MKVYIIHGYGATPEDHWFLWIKEELEKLNISTTILTMPNPLNPKPKEWESTLNKNIKNIDENTYFITHSLGSISFLNYLQKQEKVEKIGGYILVSPFNKSLQILKELDGFLNPNLDYKRLKNITENKTIISAMDDNIVPISLSESLSKSLNTKFIKVEKGGHFLGSDGFLKFTLLIEEFKKYIKV